MKIFGMKNVILICLVATASCSAFAGGLQAEYESRTQSAADAIQQHIQWGISACMNVIGKKAKRAKSYIVDSEVVGGRASYGAFTNTVYAKLSDGQICSCEADVQASSADCR